MNRFNFIFFLSTLLMSSAAFAQHKITVKIDGYTMDTCILAYQVGQTTYIAKQLFEKNKAGEFVFEGEEALMGGLYSVLIKPRNEFFQFIISSKEEQKNLKLTTKIKDNPARDLTENLKIQNSPDNDVFTEYKNFLGKMRSKSETYIAQLNTAKENNDIEAVEKANKLLQGLDGEVMAFQDDLIKKYPKFLSPKIIKGSRQVDVPKELTTQEEVFAYYKKHFWDDYDWTDERLIRTPLFRDKMETYIERLTVQQVDSVSASCIYIIDKALEYKNKDVFQFAAVELLNKYAQQEIICMDGVYVSIAQKYYCSGLAYWLDSTEMVNICSDAAKMAPLRCGEMAPEARLKNIKDSSYVSLYSIKKPFVAVYFWDPACGSCSKTSEKIVPIYDKYKDRGFEIYGVCSMDWKNVDACRNKVKEQEITWINTSDEPYPLAWVKKSYDLRSNPFIYLLDENKHIIWKRITPEQLDDILERELDLYEKKKAKK